MPWCREYHIPRQANVLYLNFTNCSLKYLGKMIKRVIVCSTIQEIQLLAKLIIEKYQYQRIDATISTTYFVFIFMFIHTYKEWNQSELTVFLKKMKRFIFCFSKFKSYNFFDIVFDFCQILITGNCLYCTFQNMSSQRVIYIHVQLSHFDKPQHSSFLYTRMSLENITHQYQCTYMCDYKQK